MTELSHCLTVTAYHYTIRRECPLSAIGLMRLLGVRRCRRSSCFDEVGQVSVSVHGFDGYADVNDRNIIFEAYFAGIIAVLVQQSVSFHFASGSQDTDIAKLLLLEDMVA